MSFLDPINQTLHSVLSSVETSFHETLSEAASGAQSAIDSFSNNLNSLSGEYRYFYSGVWREGASSGQRVLGDVLEATTIAGAVAGVGLAVYAAATTAVGAGVLKGLAYGGAVLLAGMGLSGCEVLGGLGGAIHGAGYESGYESAIARSINPRNCILRRGEARSATIENVNVHAVSIDALLNPEIFTIASEQNLRGENCVHHLPSRIIIRSPIQFGENHQTLTASSREILRQFSIYVQQRGIQHLDIRLAEDNVNFDSDNLLEIARALREMGYQGSLHVQINNSYSVGPLLTDDMYENLQNSRALIVH